MQNTPIKQKHILTLTLLIFVFLLTACSNNDNEDFASNDANRTTAEITGNIDNTIIQDYIYLQETTHLPHIASLVHNVIIHDGQIYISYVNESTIIIESILPDGTQISRTEIPTSFDRVYIATLHITENDNFALIFTGIEMTDYESNFTILYAEYTYQGTEITSRDLTETLSQTHNIVHIEQAIFTSDGDIILRSAGSGYTIVYLMDNQFNLLGEIDISIGQRMSQARDGRIVINDDSGLREIDFTSGDWGETHPIPAMNIRGLYSARGSDPFDLYIDDGTHLFGYDIETGDKTILLNWVESGIEFGFLFHMNFLDNGQISLITSHGDFLAEYWHTEHVVLTRTLRAELPDYTVITLGVVRVGDGTPLRRMVSAFNRENRYYQIQIVEYWEGGWDLADFESAETRFSIDLMTGRAHDIIIVPQHMRDAIIRQGLIIDLYPFIDADSELNRSDFFPNILTALETSEGTLPTINNAFSVETIIGMADVVGDIDSWTLTDMLTLIEQSNADSILAEWDTAERFLDWALQFSGQDFINWTENTANLDSEEFISLLEISTRLPHEFTYSFEFGDEIASPITRMLRREQLLDRMFLFEPRTYLMYTGMLGDDLVAPGLPTENGGVHLIHMGEMFAISANSPHQDVAWSFIRQFLLPNFDSDDIWSFPLRLDLFEELITEAMTPYMIIDEDGNEIESAQGAQGMGDFIVDIYAMTETEEQGLRNIIESAGVLGHFDETISNMVREETLPFFAGTRSATDTARILQNRVTIYLSERS